jgi:hypothetical protein
MLPLCCKGVLKIFTKDNYENCMSETECDRKLKEDNYCCLLYCMAKISGFLKDDEIDKEAALENMRKAIDDDPKWTNVKFHSFDTYSV